MAPTSEHRPNDPAAHELLRAAHDAGYRFPPDFGGFRATVQFHGDDTTATGTVEVRTSRELALDIDADENIRGWLQQEIASIAGHRWPMPYSEADGKYSLSLEGTGDHPLGQLIRVNDDRYDSSYRVRDGRITQVSRRIGGTRFSILIQDRVTAGDGRILPAQFTVAYWSVEENRLIRADAYTDSYAEAEGLHLPSLRRVITADDSGLVTRELRLLDHQLLEPGGDVPAGALEHRRSRAG